MALAEHKGRTTEELVARHIAPVKAEYWQASAKQALQIPSSTQGSPGEPATTVKKSIRQRKKERAERKATNLCNQFAAGKCRFGNNCKFSHDAESFLEKAPPPLLGPCPFSALDRCPFGIACRWAPSHQSEVEQESRLQPGQAHETDYGLTAAVSTAEHTPKDRTVLPVADAIEEPVNSLSKDVQGQLRRGQYDFTSSNQVLKVLNDRRALEGASKKRQRQQGRPEQQQQEQPLADRKVVTESYSVQQETPDTVVRVGEAAGRPCSACQQSEGAVNGDHTEVSPPAPQTLQADPLPASPSIRAHQQAATAADSHTGEIGDQPASKRVCAAEPPVSGKFNSHSPDNALDQRKVLLFDVRCAADAHEGTDGPLARLHLRERKQMDFRNKLYLAPLTTVGNLPFRRVCKGLGADVTCGEMALATNLLQGQSSEWALLKRHPCEDMFGVQICGGYTDSMTRCAQLLEETVDVSFVDVNCGCPIDLICSKGAGSALLQKPDRLGGVMRGVVSQLTCPVTLKVRTGYTSSVDVAHALLAQAQAWGVCAATVHGRSRQQRYSGQANWDYIAQCAAAAPSLQLIGNGDIFSHLDYEARLAASPQLATVMIARGALIKPWIFTEIKERRHWDITAGERLELLRQFCSCGLQHWGSDARGVETTRRFLLEWLSFLHRYIPVALLEVVPQRLQWRAPSYVGRSDLETLLASESAVDWVRISEMLLGPAPAGFTFTPKHKSNAHPPSAAQAAVSSEQAGAEEQENG